MSVKFPRGRSFKFNQVFRIVVQKEIQILTKDKVTTHLQLIFNLQFYYWNFHFKFMGVKYI